MNCRICNDPSSYEDEIHTFSYCRLLIDEDDRDKSVKFEHIFANIDLQIHAVKYFMKLINKRKIMMEIRR